jgi:hypothetical protein
MPAPYSFLDQGVQVGIACLHRIKIGLYFDSYQSQLSSLPVEPANSFS